MLWFVDLNKDKWFVYPVDTLCFMSSGPIVPVLCLSQHMQLNIKSGLVLKEKLIITKYYKIDNYTLNFKYLLDGRKYLTQARRS